MKNKFRVLFLLAILSNFNLFSSGTIDCTELSNVSIVQQDHDNSKKSLNDEKEALWLKIKAIAAKAFESEQTKPIVLENEKDDMKNIDVDQGKSEAFKNGFIKGFLFGFIEGKKYGTHMSLRVKKEQLLAEKALLKEEGKELDAKDQLINKLQQENERLEKECNDLKCKNIFLVKNLEKMESQIKNFIDSFEDEK